MNPPEQPWRALIGPAAMTRAALRKRVATVERSFMLVERRGFLTVNIRMG